MLFSNIIYSQSVPSYVPTNGLVGWWGFNGNAQDGSGNGNHGTVNGATLTTDRFGNPNGAYDFDGVDDYIQLQSPLLNNAITISFWAYDDGGYPNTYSINPRYVSSEFCNGGFALVNNVVNSPNGIFFARNRGSSSDALFSTVSPAYQVNQNIVFTYDGNVGKFYINGNLVSSINNTGNITTSANLFFGKSGCNNAGQMIDAFNGKLDDIGIWNRALTQQEITNLYNANSVGINENIQSNLFSIFPNPTQSLINVKVDNKHIGVVYYIYENTGKVALTGIINSENTTIDLGNLSGGLYMLMIGDNMKQKFKIIKSE